MLKEELDKSVLALIGPKDDRDDPKKVNKLWNFILYNLLLVLFDINLKL